MSEINLLLFFGEAPAVYAFVTEKSLSQHGVKRRERVIAPCCPSGEFAVGIPAIISA
jgi:hypothetical protein